MQMERKKKKRRELTQDEIHRKVQALVLATKGNLQQFEGKGVAVSADFKLQVQITEFVYLVLD